MSRLLRKTSPTWGRDGRPRKSLRCAEGIKDDIGEKFCDTKEPPLLRRVVFVWMLSALAVVFLLPHGAHADRLFTSGFETANFTETEWSFVFEATSSATTVHSGAYAAKFQKSLNAI